jgi:hypothetical protein
MRQAESDRGLSLFYAMRSAVTASAAGTAATRAIRGPPSSVCLPEILFKDRT